MLGFLMRKRKVRSDGGVFFAFIGVVLTLLALGVVMQRNSWERIAIDETPFNDVAEAAKALPEGARELAVADVGPAIDPTYAYAYETDKGVDLAIVRWSRPDGAYVVASTVGAGMLGLEDARAPHIAAHRPGWGGTILAIEAATSGRSVTSFVAYADTVLEPLRVSDASGAIRPAIFASGLADGAYADVRFEDLDGDDVMELVVTEGDVVADPSGAGDEHRMVHADVYRWNGTVLAHDDRASWMFSLSGEVFPEPVAE